MATEIQWRPSFAASALNAAEGLSHGLTPVDARLTEPLKGPATTLQGGIASLGLPAARLWRHLVGLSATNEVARQLVETALTKTIGRNDHLPPRAASLVAAVSEVLAAFRTAVPNSLEELALRERPLREQWEARGPGLLAHIAIRTEAALLPPTATVVLVHPTFGGGGEAHLPYNSVRIEAVLANPHADLPEVVRLAWLISQVQLDLPAISETIHADRLPQVARFAMLPAALAAAQEVELVRFSPDLVAQAITAWRLPAPAGIDPAALLVEWWETYEQSRPQFSVALAALDRMFG
jgi:hypothetical protein